MNMNDFASREFITLKLIEGGLTKCVITDEGKREHDLESKEERFVIGVRASGKDYALELNPFVVKKVIQAWGPESRDWMGKTLKLSVGSYKGKATKNIEPDSMKVEEHRVS